MQKGMFIFILAALVILMTGCSVIKESVMSSAPDLNKPFTCGFAFSREYEQSAKPLEAQGVITRYGTGIWELDMEKPDTLSGLHLTYNDEGVTASLGGLSFGTAKEDIKSTAVFDMVFKAIDDCAAQPHISVTESERGAEYAGTTANFSYTLIFEPMEMTPVGIEFPSNGMYVELSGYTDIAAAVQ